MSGPCPYTEPNSGRRCVLANEHWIVGSPGHKWEEYVIAERREQRREMAGALTAVAWRLALAVAVGGAIGLAVYEIVRMSWIDECVSAQGYAKDAAQAQAQVQECERLREVWEARYR